MYKLRSGVGKVWTIFCGVAMTIPAMAQQSHPAAEPAPAPASAPASTPVSTPASAPVPDPMRTDWANLKRFHDENAALAAPAAGVKRVVFMGDSITQGWAHHGVPPEPASPSKDWINRGISGQTTPQMLIRFRADVIDLKPSAVVFLAGINDIAGNTGPMTLEQTEGNLASMAELAAAHDIKVVLCSVLPAYDFPWRPGLEPAPKVVAVNTWMKSYATQHGFTYVDYYSATVDSRGGLPANLSHDGVHPLPAGYAIMLPLVEAGINKALAGN
jgi:lysophospholipase L1-like esterase